MPSVSAQDPVLEPAWITEGTLPLWMRLVLFMLPVRPGLSIIMSTPGVLLRNGWSGWNEDMIGIMQSPNNFGLSFRVIRKNNPRFLLVGLFVMRQSVF